MTEASRDESAQPGTGSNCTQSGKNKPIRRPKLLSAPIGNRGNGSGPPIENGPNRVREPMRNGPNRAGPLLKKRMNSTGGKQGQHGFPRATT